MSGRGAIPGGVAVASWTEDEIETVRRLWADGFSVTRIGERLGRSRNAISGIMNRRRDLFPKKQARPAREGRKPVASAPRPALAPRPVVATMPVFEAEPMPDLPAIPFEPSNPQPFGAILNGQCRYPLWPMSDNPGADGLCCAEPVAEGSVWCGHHRAICCTAQKAKVTLPYEARVISRGAAARRAA